MPFSHISDSSNEFYGDTACGTLVAVDGTLYGPATIPAGGSASPRIAYTPLSQTAVTGTGTTLDPYQIITEVQLGSSGLRIEQTDRYVAGEEAYRTDVTLINDEPYPRSATIYRAGDCYLQDSDWGFGSADNATGAVACIGTDDGGATPGSRREEWIPLQGASHYYESFYNSVWTRIGQQQDFPDSADSDVYQDNGAGLSWFVTLSGSSSDTVAHLTSFSPELASVSFCPNEQTDHYAGPGPDQPGVTVWYDPAYLVDPRRAEYTSDAAWIANQVQSRAQSTLARYHDLGFSVSPRVDIRLVCNVTTGAPAITLGPDSIEMSIDNVRTWFADAIVDHGKTGLWDLSKTENSWRTAVDHELFHTLQYVAEGSFFAFLYNYGPNHDRLNDESSATLGADLVDAYQDDTDLGNAQGDDYLQQTMRFYRDGNFPIDITENQLQAYEAAAVLQFWGEHYGPQDVTDLEQRVADFADALINAPGTRLTAMGNALGYDYTTQTYPSITSAQARERAVDAYREAMLAAYVHDAGGGLFQWYRYLDEVTPHTGHSGSVAPYPASTDLRLLSEAAPHTWSGQHLRAGSARVYQVGLPAGTQSAQVSLAPPNDPRARGDFASLRVAVVLESDLNAGASRTVWVADANMFGGSSVAGETPGLTVNVGSWQRLGIVVVGGPSLTSSYDLSVTVDGASQPTQPASALSNVGELTASGSGLAGMPVDVGLNLSDAVGPIAGAAVTATVTDPNGQTRFVQLRDEGTAAAGARNDGAYGGAFWGTMPPGTYQISAEATGIDNSGQAFDDTYATSTILAAAPDSDGDGVVDALETAVGLDPQDPADGSVDIDHDGLGFAAELTQGSDPFAADTDGAGEADGSEIARGMDPTAASDDDAPPIAALAINPQDGSLVGIRGMTQDQTGSIEVYRTDSATWTSLGTLSGAGFEFTDGPLIPGSYDYVGVPISDAGARGAPELMESVTAAQDVTPPTVRIAVNEGNWEAPSTDVGVRFVDLSEPAVSYRIAESQDALETASWQPFTAVADFSLTPDLGEHALVAQVRDAAGNISSPASGVVFLVDETPPSSAVGPLEAQYPTEAIDVPFSASDDLTGVASVSLWWRFSGDGGATWTTWAEGPSGTSSPISFAFPSGPGLYEFYTIATDDAGNLELPPSVADATTTFVAGTAPTLNVSGQSAITSGSCGIIQGPASPVTTSPAQCVSLILSGDAHADQVIDSIEVRVYGVFGGGGSALLTDWQVVEPLDGAYDSGDESFAVIYPYDDGGWSAFTVDARAFSQGAEGDVSLFVPIDRTPPPPADTTPPVTHVDQLPGTTRDSSILLTGSAYDDESSWITVEIFYRFRSSNHVAWGDWIGGITFSALPNPSPFSRAFLFPDGKGYYEFYSIGTDENGNVEAPPGSADASIQKK